MRTQAKILLPRSCKNKTTCPKETTVNLSIFAAFHTTYLKSGRPFTFNDYDPEERRLLFEGCSTILQDTHAHSHFILAVKSEKGQLLTFVAF